VDGSPQLPLFDLDQNGHEAMAFDGLPRSWQLLTRHQRLALLEADFLRNLTRPGHPFSAIENVSCTDQCEWRCSANSAHPPWQTRLVQRARKMDPATCPECSWENRHMARSAADSVAGLAPHLTAEFVANLDHPGRDLSMLRPSSPDRCHWRCSINPEHEWTTTADKRVNRHHGCPKCGLHGRSRLEEEVAGLLRAATGLTVLTDVRVTVSGCNRPLKMDLFVQELMLFIELDPLVWHVRRVKQDRAKTTMLMEAGVDVVRLREPGLPDVPGPVVETIGGNKAKNWSDCIRDELERRGVTWRELSDADVAQVLGDVHRSWSTMLSSKPSPSALDVAPHLADEFVENLTRAGVGLDWLSPGAADMILWQCGVCPRRWRASVLDRASAGYGCRSCSLGAAGRRRMVPDPGKSLLDLYPGVAAEFVSCERDSQLTAADLKAFSNQRCKFRCRTCDHTWTAILNNRTRLGSGCPACSRRKGERLKVGRPRRGSLQERFPELAKQFVRCHDLPSSSADDIAPMTRLVCRWRCECGREWDKAADYRVKKFGETGSASCPECRRSRRRRV
jgi:hypothetical protein